MYAPKKKKVAWRYLIFVAPAFVLHMLVVTLPSFRTLYYAFFDWSGIGQAVFVGFDNFVEMFTIDETLQTALRNTLVWTLIFVTIPIILGVFVAVLVSGVKRGQMFYRTVYFLPHVLAAAIVGRIWSTFYNPFFGFGAMFRRMGLDGLADVLWLGDPNIALFSVAFVGNWHWWGFVMVLFVAALHQVDPDLYEAARVEGCGKVRLFIHVTLPGILNTFVFVVMLSLMWSIISFDFIWVMTMGGPGRTTEMLSTWIYKNAFIMSRAGYASAISVLQMAIVTVIFVGNRFLGKKVVSTDL